jgi:peptidoglycan/xylan/chitin deacetylase (PgdA/CDA1 family)
MRRCLDRYDAITAEFGIRPTWPTTACVLARHPGLLRRYAENGAELALHGLVHGDHAALGRDQQRETIARSLELFERAGLRPSGFRGPYLRYNEGTLLALQELGLRYHSSQAVLFPLRAGDHPSASAPRYLLALKLYDARDARELAVTPRLRDGLVDIPVAIPDDEILVERLRLDDHERRSEWRSILEITYERGDLFTLQLHPERIPELGAALHETLAEARRRQPPVYVARLDEIASWWLRRSRFSLQVVRAGEARHRVHLDAAADVTLLVRGVEVARTAWHGRDAITQMRDFEVESPRAPVVGVSRRSPSAVHSFLAEEGLPVEVSDDPEPYGAFVDVPGSDWTEAAVLDRVEAGPGPLVRVWRWPRGARSALAVTGDVDALTLRDFLVRSWETRSPERGGWRPR